MSGYALITNFYGEAAKWLYRNGNYDEACEYYDKQLTYAKLFDDFLASERSIGEARLQHQRQIKSDGRRL